MTFIWRVTYYPLDSYGMRITRTPRTGHIRGRTREIAIRNARRKFGEIVSVE